MCRYFLLKGKGGTFSVPSSRYLHFFCDIVKADRIFCKINEFTSDGTEWGVSKMNVGQFQFLSGETV